MREPNNYETGVAIGSVAVDIHRGNQRWWRHPSTGEPLPINVPEKLMLVVSELSEALEAHRKNLHDSHLPHRPGLEVELADAVIRILDMSVGLGLDIGGAISEKLDYNKTRLDHSDAARLLPGGKKY